MLTETSPTYQFPDGEEATRQASPYEKIIDSLPVAVYTCDKDGYITYYNTAAAVLWGHRPRIGEDRWCGSWKIYGPDGITPLLPDQYPMAITLKEGRKVTGEEILIECPDGTRKNILPSPEPILDALGNITGAVNTLLDITERKTAEKQQAMLAAIVESAEDAIVSKTLEGIITSWNLGAEKLFGYTAEEIIGQPVSKLIPADRIDEEPLILKRLKKGEKVEHFETKRVTKTGELLDISLTISPIRDNKGFIIGASKIARNITAAKLLRNALQESEERLRMAAESTQLGTWEYYPQTQKLVWSEKCKAIYGLPADREPDNQFVADHNYAGDREYIHQEVQKAMDPDGDGDLQMEYRVIRPGDKQLRWLKVHGKMHFAGRQPERFLGTMLDITDSKVAEKQQATLAAIVESAEDAIVSKTLEGIVTSWNRGAEKLFGYTAEEMTGQPITRLIPADHIEEEPLILERLKKGETVEHFETKRITKTGKLLDISLTISPIRDSKGTIIGASKIARDITAGKLLLEALREREERLRMASESTQLGTWEYQPLTGKLNWSDECRNIYGVPAGLEVDYSFFSDHIFPADKAYAQSEIQKAMDPAGQGNYNVQYRIIRHSDGQTRWIRTQGKVYFNSSNGQAERFIGTVLDITEQKMHEQELKDSVELFQTMADNAPAMIWMSGTDRFNDYFNKTWLEFTGKTIGQESNEGWLKGVHPDDMQKCIDTYAQALEEQKGFYTEYRLLRHDGQYRWISDNCVPRFSPKGKFLGFISACMDIDDQKRSEEKILASELLFKTISNVSPVGLWMTDTGGKNVFVNDTWIEWTGMPVEEQSGTGWLDKVVEEDKIAAPARFRECMEKREKYTTEFRIIRKDGELRWCLTEGSPYYDINGEFAGYAGSVTDITDIKKLEQRKDDFIKMASHELKTPITSIKGYVQLLLNIYEDLNEEKLQAAKTTVKSSLNTISKQVTKLTRLVSELLDLTRIESGKLELHKTGFDPVALVEETVQDARQTTSRHALIIHNDFEGKLYADRDRIAQVLLNLLTNAIKYSPEAGQIEVFINGNKKSVSVSVADYGIGIDKKEQQKIFERFYRVEGKNEQTYPGFGIGLFIASEIIQRHNGSITVKSEKDKGSVFTFTLPTGV
jgi:PAS domain S-box-containing protein